MSAKILELNPPNRRYPMSDNALRLLATLHYGPAIASVMAVDLAKIPPVQQSALAAVFAFHLMGGNLQASFEMVKRLPMFLTTSDIEIQEALQALCDAGLLEFERGYFSSRACMAGIEKAVEQFEIPAEARDPS